MKEFIHNSSLEILAFLVIFFGDIQSALFAIGFLIVIDTLTGIWKAYKKGGLSNVTSHKAARIISKLLLYPLALIVAKVSQMYLSPAIPWIDVTAGILAVIEVKSIFENMSSILGFNLWKRIKEALSREKDLLEN